jgi:hypothetical protein
MSSFHAGVTTGLNVPSSAGEGTERDVVDGVSEGDAGGGGWGLALDDFVPGFDGLLSECRGGYVEKGREEARTEMAGT